MQNAHTTEAHAGQQQARQSAFGILNDLGGPIQSLAALLRAAVNTDPNHPNDEGWLVSLAYDEAVKLEGLYSGWANAPSEVTK